MRDQAPRRNGETDLVGYVLDTLDIDPLFALVAFASFNLFSFGRIRRMSGKCSNFYRRGERSPRPPADP